MYTLKRKNKNLYKLLLLGQETDKERSTVYKHYYVQKYTPLKLRSVRRMESRLVHQPTLLILTIFTGIIGKVYMIHIMFVVEIIGIIRLNSLQWEYNIYSFGLISVQLPETIQKYTSSTISV